MGDKAERKSFDEEQEDICKLCEDRIIHGCHMTSTFLCEGRFCDEAFQLLTEALKQEKQEGVK